MRNVDQPQAPASLIRFLSPCPRESHDLTVARPLALTFGFLKGFLTLESFAVFLENVPYQHRAATEVTSAWLTLSPARKQLAQLLHAHSWSQFHHGTTYATLSHAKSLPSEQSGVRHQHQWVPTAPLSTPTQTKQTTRQKQCTSLRLRRFLSSSKPRAPLPRCWALFLGPSPTLNLCC